jgi:hypothetical protein
MSKPNLTVTVEPTSAAAGHVTGNAHYLHLGAATSDGQPQNEVVLQLHIKNNESNRIEITDITFSFPQYQNPVRMQQIDTYNNMNMFGGADTYWSNGYVYLDPVNQKNQWPNMQFLNFKPTKVTVSLTCKNGNTGTNYSEPYTVTRDLIPHKSPTAEGSYLFPFNIKDLKSMEFFTASALHPSGNGEQFGTQIFAHDIGIVGYNSDLQKWSPTTKDPSTKYEDLSKEDYLIWDKPVRAIADGVVKQVHDGEDDNTVIGQFPPDPPNVSGNFVQIEITRENQPLIRAERVKFCHFKKGSIPFALSRRGATVNAGDVIGRVGHSGRSSNPHLHIEVTDSSGRALRPFPFRDAWIVDYNKLTAGDTGGLWVRLQGEGVPQQSVAIWPSSTKPYGLALSGPVVWGTWGTIKAGHELIYLRSNRILDWVPASGHYRIFNYDENATGNTNPLVLPPVASGTWADKSIMTGHQLVFIQPIDKMLDWEPANGHWRLWNYDHNASGTMNPLPTTYDQASTSNGLLEAPGRVVIPISNILLIWEVASGHWDLVKYKQSPPFQNIELFSGEHAEGTWQTIRTGHRLINLGWAPLENDKPRVLDWEEQSGHYRILPFGGGPISTNKDPLPEPPVIVGTWQTIHTGHKLVYLGGDRLLDWEPASGYYRIWNYDRR